MPKKHTFKAKGYLEKSYLDKDGAKHISFEISHKDALQVAKLELMGRDLESHNPVLLDITAKISLAKDCKDARRKKKSQVIR